MSKSQTAWSTSTKTAVPWVAVGKSGTAWSNEANMLAPYLYSDATIPYSSATITYNYFSANQLNNRNPTSWLAGSKYAISWSNESVAQIGYAYDSSATYDNAFAYDYVVPVTNQSNNKKSTAWVNQ
jgi:hypothetical protein